MRSLVIYRNETALHLGTGTDIGYVDMPIQREKSTGFPKGEASSIKGVFRDMCTKEYQNQWFGDENEGMDETGNKGSMGKLRFTDARILFFPVRTSDEKVFVWVTCPFVLARFIEDTKMLELKDSDLLHFEKELKKSSKILEHLTDNECISLVAYPKERKATNRLHILDYIFNKKQGKHFNFPYQILISDENNYIEKKIKNDLYLISNEMFSYFCEMSTEVITRIRIGDKGVVEDGALFTEEFLPENTILYNFIEDIEKRYRKAEDTESVLADLLNVLEFGEEKNCKYEKNKSKYYGMIQLGGGKTIGKGITSVIANVYEEES